MGMVMDSRDTWFSDLVRELHYATQLIEEIRSENLPEVKQLLEVFKANPNTVVPEHGVAALHLLAGMKDEEFSVAVVQTALRRCQGDPNVRSEEGLTPVHVAAMWGRCRILQFLLSNGGNPYLVDYKLRFNAEDYALKENQWKAYRMVTTFMVIYEDVGRFEKYVEEESSATESSRTYSYSEPESGRILETAPKHEDLYVDDDEEDWISRVKGDIKLDDKSIKMIKNHKRDTKVYEYPRKHCESDLSNLKPLLPKRNRRMKMQKDSEVYMWKLDESSLKSRICKSSRPNSSDELNVTSRSSDKIITKMSRIFLFMLKKRQTHIYEKVK